MSIHSAQQALTQHSALNTPGPSLHDAEGFPNPLTADGSPQYNPVDPRSLAADLEHDFSAQDGDSDNDHAHWTRDMQTYKDEQRDSTAGRQAPYCGAT